MFNTNRRILVRYSHSVLGLIRMNWSLLSSYSILWAYYQHPRHCKWQINVMVQWKILRLILSLNFQHDTHFGSLSTDRKGPTIVFVSENKMKWSIFPPNGVKLLKTWQNIYGVMKLKQSTQKQVSETKHSMISWLLEYSNKIMSILCCKLNTKSEIKSLIS